ncbi:hypothetical protein LHU53_12405 [Rhodoferax sp. U2-2l]|uniref:hypothetical protein n=1 Tax=Rhodoferax sp. U2-2l TaxID=2884000 RepID=UPI001D0BAB71|nr:hypothetical protein [Rhodoferax sp. U2-2l]MCB8747706.1 hypothetical protein [Rhodoferax sp. U2-2l]
MNPSLKTLQAAHLKYAGAVESQQKILSVIASQSLPDVDSTRLDVARSAYESAAADMAIGLSNDAGLAEATKAFKVAQQDHEKAVAAHQHSQAVVNGLQSKLQAANAAIEAAKSVLTAAEGAYLTHEIEAADTEYLRLAHGVQEQWLRIAACTKLLLDRKLSARFVPKDPVMLTGIGPTSCAFVLETRPHEPTGIGQPLFVNSSAEALKRAEIRAQMEADSKASGLFSKAMAAIKN